MTVENYCPHCHGVLKPGEKCGCPGAAREQKKEQAIRERSQDAVHILLEKRPGQEDFRREMEASSTTALINALAVLMLETAYLLRQPVDKVYAVVATVLFADPGKAGES